MFHSNITLKEGAIFITDAHYNKPKGETQLYELLQKIAKEKIKTSQLFLLGDIFDALFGGVPHTAKANAEVIELIKQIAKKIEVIYLEGNHDFQLRKFFHNDIALFPLQKQPVVIHAGKKRICLAHGDFDAPIGYKFYTWLIRNRVILFFLNLYDMLTNHSILNFVERHMSKKEQCKKYEWFSSDFIKKRFESGYSCDIFVEGHFHQNRSFVFEHFKYVNLGAFACNQRYFVVKFVHSEIIFEEQTLS